MPRKKLNYSYFIQSDPRRAPAWRYERAQKLIANKQTPHPDKDDEDVLLLRKYYLAKRRLRYRFDDDHRFMQEVAARFGYLWAADRIYFEGRSDRIRYALEAMLLARVPIDEIASFSGVEPKAISTYEQMFFNVSDRLDNRNYIASVVLLDAFMSGLPNRSREITAKYFAYFGGPIVLKLILDGFDGSIPAPMEPHDTSRWLDHHFRLVYRTVTVIGATFFDPNNYNVRTLFEGYQALLSLGYREQSVSGDDNVVNQALEMLVKQNPIPLGDQADRLAHRPGRLVASGKIEPRVSELAGLRQENILALADYSDDWKPDRQNKNELQPSTTD